MNEKFCKAVVKYKPLFADRDSAFKIEHSLDTITFSGVHLVVISHNGTNLGLPIDDCGEEHYIVGTLVVTDCGTDGPVQNNRVIGQVLTLTSRKNKETKVYSRTFADGLWGSWVDLGAAKTTDIQDGAITAQKLSTEVRDKVDNPLRPLFIAAGADYNDSGADKTKTAPWGESVTHKTGHYYLNGLGDITEEQMTDIYTAGCLKNNISGFYARNARIRTFFPARTSGQEGYGTVSLSGMLSGAAFIETVVFTDSETLAEKYGVAFTAGITYASFANCSNLVYIQKMNFSNITSLLSAFDKCNSLVSVKIYKLKCNLGWGSSMMISKESVLYTIQNAIPTSAITITLHPEAYSRLSDDAEIISALEEQPLISLVSA